MRPILLLVLSTITIVNCYSQSAEQLKYIEKYKDIAVQEMDRAGIPASIKLAQGLLESAAGTSYLATNANNHFGMKCGSAWDGKTLYRKDDDYDEHGKLRKSCFRVYKSGAESFIAHSEFLRDPRKEYRYGFLFRINPSDYKSWARGLKKSGYATSATYDKKLIAIIERFDLHKFDKMTSTDVFTESEPSRPGKEVMAGINYNNDVRVVVTGNGQTPGSISETSGIAIEKLRRFNENLPGRNTELAEGSIIYLQSKRNSYRGDRKWHYVQPGETMYDISQLYGVKLSKLYSRNLMPDGTQPASGARIRLRGKIRNEADRPKLSSETPNGGVAFAEEGELELEDDFWSPEIPITLPTKDTEEPFMEEPIEDEVELELDPIEPRIDPVIEEPILEVPVTEPVPEITEPVRPDEVTHTVIKGDTLYSLSKRYGTTVDKIKQLNNLSDNIISVGQKLKIK